MKNIKKNITVTKIPAVSKIILIILGLVLCFTCLYSFYGCTSGTQESKNSQTIANLDSKISDYIPYFTVTTKTYDVNPSLTQITIQNISQFNFIETALTLAFLDTDRNLLFTEQTGVQLEIKSGANVEYYTKKFEDMLAEGDINSEIKYVYVIEAKDYYFA